MQTVIDFVTNHPEITTAIAVAAESIVMPFIPVKYNGLAMTIFGFFIKKKA